MPAISRDEAVRRLEREIAPLPPDELAEVYNELFPGQPATEDQARQDGSRLLNRITDHVRRGLHPEEIVSLWNVVFPRDRHVSYDDETGMLQYGESSESVQYAD